MPSEDDIKHRFWKALRADMTVMLGLPGKAAGRPMTAMFRGKEDRGPIWFFTSKDTDLAQALAGGGTHAELAFVARDHDLFATAHGRLSAVDDRQAVDDLWNRFVAAWFEGGKDDPKLQLLRFDGEEAQVWLDANSLVAGLKMLLGVGDPKEDYKDDVANIRMG